MKNMKKNGIILGLITLVVLYFVLKDNFAAITRELFNSNPLWIIVSFLIIILYCFFQSLAIHEIIKNYEPEYKYKKSLQLSLITNFFNGITPFSTGGQPMQIYLLKKDGIRVTNGTNIIIQNFILYQLALVIYGIISLFLNYQFHIFENLPVLGGIILIGFAINTLIMVGLFIISFGKRLNKFLVKIGLKVLTKFKLVNNTDKLHDEWNERCETFHSGAVSLIKNYKVCIKGFIYQFLGLTCLYVLPLFVFYALGSKNISAIEAITSSAYVMIIGSFVPIPGASGGIEYGFLRFFGTFIKDSVLSAGLLLWRFISYYLLMIVGGIVLSFRKDMDK